MPVFRLFGGSWVTSLSSKAMLPLVGSMKPAIMRRRVVLPQPEGPRRKKRSPGLMVSERLSTAVAADLPLPKILVRLSIWILVPIVGDGRGLERSCGGGRRTL